MMNKENVTEMTYAGLMDSLSDFSEKAISNVNYISDLLENDELDKVYKEMILGIAASMLQNQALIMESNKRIMEKIRWN